MTPRAPRADTSRPASVPMYRGPQAHPPGLSGAALHHAPNAALLIDFDNVTMGIQKELKSELRALLSSDIIKGKVAVQRAYADWRRYPQYVVPLTESSIDMIMAPAYGSSKKNATDIRLAVDAMELVFTRPEIGTYILLSGDSDFSSLVVKLKEYGKYVIGVGIRESSSDLLVMNCDEYYSYNALAGLVKTGEGEAAKRDPWELVVEAAERMKRNGDVMRADRLKQVMQDIDQSFDEHDLGMAKFSRFAQEAAHRGLITLHRLENGQMEVDVASANGATPPVAEHAREAAREAARPAARDETGRRSRRGRGGRGREREQRTAPPAPTEAAGYAPPLEEPISAPPPRRAPAPPAVVEPVSATERPPEPAGERLTRDEAFDIVRRAVADLTSDADDTVMASAVRSRARAILERDSESLSERNFARILRDAHDADVIDLRKRGDDYEVARAAVAQPIADQLAAAAPPPPEPGQAARSAASAAALRRGMRARGRNAPSGELPPELLRLGVVSARTGAGSASAITSPLPLPAEPEAAAPAAAEPETTAPRRGRGRSSRSTRGRSAATAPAGAEQSAPATPAAEGDDSTPAAPPKPRRSRARKTAASRQGGEG